MSVEDPLEPPRFKDKKIPREPPSPPPPVLRSPPRKATSAEQKEQMIPPCISNWKNNNGFTIPLDKCLAADGREALFVADRHTREEVRQRSLMQQKLAQEEKALKEKTLRMLAQRAREERNCSVPKPTAASQTALKSSLAAYGSDSDSDGDFGNDESYNLYDKPLFHSSTAAAAIYKALGNIDQGNKELFGGGTDEGIGKALDNDRFSLGCPRVAFEDASNQEVREGPVQFERDTSDVNQFLSEASTGKKRGLDSARQVFHRPKLYDSNSLVFSPVKVVHGNDNS
ncbi:MAG: SKIP/SNW domain-containing protein [Lentinula lateritia]|nr:MAG: SKIP/SNW domain-containing protein [Lentinula lateritia]